MKVAIQNRWKQRQIRKHVLAEIAFNTNIIWLIRTGLFVGIHAPHETSVKDPVSGDVKLILTRTNIQSSNIYDLEENRKRLQRTTYETPIKDCYQFHRLPHTERL